jgi:uncharacterized membrane protein
MTAIFEWLFKYRPLVYEKGTITLHPLWPSYITWILIALAIVGSYLLYRRTSDVLPLSWRLGLAGLRTGFFLIVILLFLQPVLRLSTTIPQQNFVAVAYDMSRSMEIRDGVGGQSRLDVERNLLRPEDNPLLDELGSKFKLRFFRFSNTAERTEAFTDSPQHGDITDFERTLSGIIAELETAPVAGIILMTDGADNHSADLDKTAAQLRARNIPVYAVGIGSRDFKRDTEILRISMPAKVLKDTMVEAEVSVRSTGYSGQQTRLSVFDEERLLYSREIMMGSDGEVKIQRASFNCPSAGSRIITFQVEPIDEEIVEQNNTRALLLRVEDSRPRILYVEGEPRYEYGFLVRAVKDDENLHLVTLLRQAEDTFLHQGTEAIPGEEERFPDDKDTLFRYKALIIGSVEASFFSLDQLRMISDFVSERGGSFLMLGGNHSFAQGGYTGTFLEDLLPVILDGDSGDARHALSTEFRTRLTGYGMLHPVTRFTDMEAQNRDRWETAPLMVGYNPTLGAKPGATVLIQGNLQDSGGQSPVILAFQRFGRGKSAALTTASTWRWQMELEHKDSFHESFWKSMLRWLVSDVSDPVEVATDKDSYSSQDTVVMKTEVHDSAFVPLNNARVTARVQAPSGKTQILDLDWDVEKNGVYETDFHPEEEGIYEVSVEALQGDETLGVQKTNFRIAPSNEEFHNAILNSDLLKRLAQDTGGRYYTPEALDALPEDISIIDTGSSRVEEKELWDMPFLFLLLLGLLSSEWILRKRKGLL